jgi:predicted transposase YdaD
MPLVVTVHSAKDGSDPIAACCIECQEMRDGRELLDWVETILVYKLLRLSREEMQTMLGSSDVELKQTRFYKEVFAEGRTGSPIIFLNVG